MGGADFQISDMYEHPHQYLNGTSPLNVTGDSRECNGDECDPDSFLWYDRLHPSEQTHRVIAREFVHVVYGYSKWATYWHA